MLKQYSFQYLDLIKCVCAVRVKGEGQEGGGRVGRGCGGF